MRCNKSSAKALGKQLLRKLKELELCKCYIIPKGFVCIKEFYDGKQIHQEISYE